MLTADQHAAARLLATQYRNVERVLGALERQYGRFVKLEGLPETFFAWYNPDPLKKILKHLAKEITAIWDGTEAFDHVEASIGLGPATYRALSLMFPLDMYANPAKVWKYLGLHPHKKEKGKKLEYSPRLKSWWIRRVAEPCMKNRNSLYRSLYDKRRAHTDTTHEEWSDGHRHNDAMRYMTKAIIVDLWRASNSATASDHDAPETQHCSVAA